MAESDPEARIRAVLERTAAALADGRVRDEAVAEFTGARRILGLERRAALKPVGRAWRLGVLLLGRDGTLRATGRITRAVDPGHPGHVAASAEVRREVRAAANRGRFTPGETVNFDAPVIDLSTDALRSTDGPLFLRDGRALVRWSVSAGDDAAADFEAYVGERAGLLLDPPRGAT